MRKSFFLMLCLLWLIPQIAFSAIPGRYEVLVPFSPPPPRSLEQVTVHVVFAFDCGHCYNFHRKEAAAIKRRFNNKVSLYYRPIGWRGPDPGRLYFIAEEKGKGNAVMHMIFDFLFDKGLGKEMFKRDKLQFVAQLNGLTEEFNTMMDDPRIVRKMENSMQFAKERKIDATPAIVIENVILPERDYANLVTIINALLKEPVR